MSKWTEAALKQREIYDIQGSYLTDTEAIKVVKAYPEWNVGIEITQKMIDEGRNRYRVNTTLYKTETAHTTQIDWAPNLAPTLWTVIDIEHTGTLEDPIPYAGNMVLENGKHYSQNGVIYICIRDTGNPVYHELSALVGLYVEEVVS